MSWTQDELDQAIQQMVWREVKPREGDRRSDGVNEEIHKLVLKLSRMAPELVSEPIRLTDFVAARVEEDRSCPFAGAVECLIDAYERRVKSRKEFASLTDEGPTEQKMRLALEGIAHEFSGYDDYWRIQWGAR